MASVGADPAKVKLLCSFGGKILPRPSDGALRYAGGHTRILSLRRSATLADLVAKISVVFPSPLAAVKYQLPGEDLDALISIASQDDVDNMLEEFDRLAAAAADGFARMRIFVFSSADLDAVAGESLIDTGQSYIDAVNGIGAGSWSRLSRKDSLLSAASSNEGASPSILSPRNNSSGQDVLKQGVLGEETLAYGRIEPQQVQLLCPSVNGRNVAPGQQYVHPVCNVAPMVTVGDNFKPIQGKSEPLAVAGNQMNGIEANFKANQVKVENFWDELRMADQSSNGGAVISSSSNGFSCNNINNGNGNNNNQKNTYHQPLSQLPPLHPTHIQQMQSVYTPPLRPYQQPPFIGDCQMCHRDLPHAHSDTLVKERVNGNGISGNNINEPKSVLHSHHTEDPASLLASLRHDNFTEARIETTAAAAGHFSPQDENVREVRLNMEASGVAKVLNPSGVNGVADTNRAKSSQTASSGAVTDTTSARTSPTVSSGAVADMTRTNTSPAAVPGTVADTTRVKTSPTTASGAVVDSEPKVEALPAGGQLVSSGFAQEVSHTQEKEKPAPQNAETFNPAKVFHPQNAGSAGALVDRVMEPKVDTVAGSAQFEVYSFNQIPRIPHDSERLLVNPNAPSAVVLPADTQASHPMHANPLHSHFSDPRQPSLQNSVSPHNLAEQDVTAKPNVSLVKNGEFHTPEPQIRFSGPQISNDYVRPITGMMESLRVSTFGPSGINGHARTASAVTHGFPMLNAEYFVPVADKSHAVEPQAGGNAVFLGNSYVTPGTVPNGYPTGTVNPPRPQFVDLKSEHLPQGGDTTQLYRLQAGGNGMYHGNAFLTSAMVPEGNYLRSINQVPPSSVDVTRLPSFHPAETSQTSTMMANHEPLISFSQEFRVQPEVPNERVLMMPACSCGNSTAYNNYNTTNVLPVGDRNGEAPWYHPNEPLNSIAVPLTSNVPIQYPNSGNNRHIEQFRGRTPSDSLLRNQDPQQILGSMPMMPPMPNQLPGKEFFGLKDVCAENNSVSNGSDVNVLAEEGGLHHVQNTLNKDLAPEPVCLVQGEEQKKQEMQDLAEQVVAPVFQPAIPPAPVTYPHDEKEHDLPSNKENGHGEANSLLQSTTTVGNHSTEGIAAKQTEKTNVASLITDDIGRLQIINNSDLEELRELGSGTFGTVYHGKWRGTDVAIKRINERCFAGKPSEQDRMRTDFWNEASKLADLHHPNVVAFYGIVLDGPGGSYATVTEFMVNGSLRRALQKNDRSLNKRNRLLVAMDVAFGMEYLHGKNIIHFDLKSDNLLVNLRDPQRPICKVADLGLSKVKRQTLISGGVRGTLPWMAPELLNGCSSLVSEKVDVFSFGIVMWELLTGEEPYADLHYGAIIGGIVSNTLRPPIPESCDPEWRALMEQCWSTEPLERPSFTEVANRLRSMAASLPHNNNNHKG